MSRHFLLTHNVVIGLMIRFAFGPVVARYSADSAGRTNEGPSDSELEKNYDANPV